MIRTFYFDDSNEKAKALLEYLEGLDFVNEKTNDYVLDDEQISILEERRVNRRKGQGKSVSWDKAKKDITPK